MPDYLKGFVGAKLGGGDVEKMGVSSLTVPIFRV